MFLGSCLFFMVFLLSVSYGLNQYDKNGHRGVTHYDERKLVIPERKAVRSTGLLAASRLVSAETHPECSQLPQDVFVHILGYKQIRHLFPPPNSTCTLPGLNFSTNAQ